MKNKIDLSESNPESFLLLIQGKDDKPLVTINYDGTVKVYHKGADKEAAETFYKSLELEGIGVFAKIKALEEENKKLKEQTKA